MTANRREAFTYDFRWSEIADVRPNGDGTVTILRPKIEPPGLARNRRAREAWVDLTPGARRAKRKLRVERGYISRTWGWS